jgi:hypothetical protein
MQDYPPSRARLEAPRGATWLATAFTYYLDKLGSVLDFLASAGQPRSLTDASTPQDVINYANRIRHTQPAFADDLIAAANRHNDGL